MAFDPITAGLNFASKMMGSFGKLVPDADLKNKLQAELQEKATEFAGQIASDVHEELSGQIEIDKAEAASPDSFVRRWRPWLGWYGGTSYVTICVMTVTIGGVIHDNFMVTTGTSALGLLVLGLCGLRSTEKINGAAGGETKPKK